MSTSHIVNVAITRRASITRFNQLWSFSSPIPHLPLGGVLERVITLQCLYWVVTQALFTLYAMLSIFYKKNSCLIDYVMFVFIEHFISDSRCIPYIVGQVKETQWYDTPIPTFHFFPVVTWWDSEPPRLQPRATCATATRRPLFTLLTFRTYSWVFSARTI